MAISDKDAEKIADAVWKKKFGDQDAQWHLDITHRTLRRFLGVGGSEDDMPEGKNTLLNKIWQAVKS